MDRGAQNLTVASGAGALTVTHAGVDLAVRVRAGSGPAVVFLPGYRSDMSGAKATALDGWAATRGRAFVRFDYSGCGASGGDFADGTIGRWTADAAAVLAGVCPGPAVLVGSSMGAWIALLLARAQPAAAVVTIAGAPDFTAWGLDGATADVQRPSRYGDGDYPYSAALIADGAAQCLLPGPIAVGCPVRLLHGQADPDVPWRLSLEVAAALRSFDVQVTLVKDGDHRLSRPTDLALLTATLDALPGGTEA